MNLPITLTEAIPLVTLIGGTVVAFATAYATYKGIYARNVLRGEVPRAPVRCPVPVELSDEDRKQLKELSDILAKLVEEIHDHRREIYDLAGEIRRTDTITVKESL